ARSCLSAKASPTEAINHIHLTADDSAVVLRATDYAKEIEIEVAGDVSDIGAVALPGPVFVSAAQRLPDGSQVTLQLGDGGKRCRMTSGRSRFELRTLDHDEFPARKTIAEGDGVRFEISAPVLDEMLNEVAYVADTKHPNLFCCGVCLQIVGNELRAVATTRIKLALSAVAWPGDAEGMPDIIVPLEAVQVVRSIIRGHEDAVELTVGNALLVVRVPGIRFATQLIDARFLDYS